MAYYIFDLDGTITNSAKGIINSIFYTLDFYNIEKPKFEESHHLIGPPLLTTFQNLLPSTIAPKDAVKKYREYYSEKGIYENELYSNVYDTLIKLHNNNHTIALATAKPTFYAKIVLKHFDLLNLFKVVVGSHLSGNRTDKKEIIYEVADQLGWKTTSENTYMIGDRASDIIGGKYHQFKTVAALYGYGTHEEITESNPDYIIDNIASLPIL
jgi:phosphoglycolate phosphatase